MKRHGVKRLGTVVVSGGAVVALAIGLLTTFSLVGSPDRRSDPPSTSPSTAPAAVQDPLAQSIAAAQAHLVARPDDYQTWADLGLAYVQRAKITVDPSYYAKATGAVARSLKLDATKNFAGYGAQAALQNGLHNFTAARDAALTGIAINRFNSTLFGALGDAYTQLGEYDKAAAAIDTMNRLLPGVPAFTRASYVLELRGDIGGSQAALERALQDSANGAGTSFAQNALGELAFNYGGNAAAALRHFQAGLDAAPKDFTLLAGRAKAEVALGQTQQALTDYRTVVNAIPQPQYVLELAELEQSLRDPDAARQYALFRTEERLFQSAGVALDVEPTLFEADHGDAKQALTFCAAGWKVRPFLEMADACAWANYVNKRYPEALGWAGKAASTGWHNALFLFHRGMIEAAMGNRAAARTDLANALALNPHFNVLQAPVARQSLAGLR